MNKKHKLTIGILFLNLLSIVAFSACDKDTHCYLDVNVYNGNSSRPISGAKVQIYQSACDTSDFNYMEGTTDGEGIFSTEYAAPAILQVRATLMLDTLRNNGTQQGFRRGMATVRLVEGETKACTVRVPQDTLWMEVNE